MTITIEAMYENGVLLPTGPLPLKEREIVQITINTTAGRAELSAGVIPCQDPQLIEWAALDADLDFPPPPEARGVPLYGPSQTC